METKLLSINNKKTLLNNISHLIGWMTILKKKKKKMTECCSSAPLRKV